MYHSDEEGSRPELAADAVSKTRGNSLGSGRTVASFTVVSYNILADSVLSFEYLPYCQRWSKEQWARRPGRILDKIITYTPDLICLQEVDEELHRDFFSQELERRGYEGCYFQRTGDQQDGCATFALREKLRIRDVERVPYKDEQHPALDRDNVALLMVVEVDVPDQESAAATTDNVALDAAGAEQRRDHDRPDRRTERLQEGSHEPGQENRSVLIIANTHLLFNPRRGDVKLAQAMVLLDRLARITKRWEAVGVVVCGDFNATPDSALYDFMVNGQLDVKGLDRYIISGVSERSTKVGNRPNHMMPTCGVMPRRVEHYKHQGGGCALGIFERESCGDKARSRDSDSEGSKIQAATIASTSSNCACGGRPPHFAPLRLVSRHDAAFRNVALPPHMAQDSDEFAVVDPASCRCRSSTVHESATSVNEPPSTRGDLFPPLIWKCGARYANEELVEKARHDFTLNSAYAQRPDAHGTGEPAFTTYHHRFKGTVDYIFYGSLMKSTGENAGSDSQGASPCLHDSTPGGGVKLRCAGIVEPPLHHELKMCQGIPSPQEPSDHISLVARFELFATP